MKTTVHVDVLYIPGCPHWPAAMATVEQALDRLQYRGATVNAVPINVGDPRLRGSPTILIDGVDPFPAGAATTGCRLYWSGAGLSGIPPVDELISVLRTANR